MSLTLREESESLIEIEKRKNKKKKKESKEEGNVGKKVVRADETVPKTITELGIFLHGQKQAIKK